MKKQELKLDSIKGNQNNVTIHNHPAPTFRINDVLVSENTFNLATFDNLKAAEAELKMKNDLITELRKEVMRLKKAIKELTS